MENPKLRARAFCPAENGLNDPAAAAPEQAQLFPPGHAAPRGRVCFAGRAGLSATLGISPWLVQDSESRREPRAREDPIPNPSARWNGTRAAHQPLPGSERSSRDGPGTHPEERQNYNVFIPKGHHDSPSPSRTAVQAAHRLLAGTDPLPGIL